MRPKVCEMLGIDTPIVLAPMGGAVGAEIAAAVCNAGGLGTLPLWSRDIPTLKEIVRATRALTSNPFAVNLNMQFPQEERLNACLEEEVPIISFFWDDPGHLIRKAKDSGAIVMHSVGTSEEARKAVDGGVDIIVAQGWEAGGHVRGMVTTLALVPAVVDAVGDTPVIAAGGIADGRGLAAVMALGAQAGWIGTRFLASEEATIHPDYRQRILRSTENDTVHLEDLYDGGWPAAPHRALRNSTINAWEAAGRPPVGQRAGAEDVILRYETRPDVLRYDSHTPGPDAQGEIEPGSMWAGQSVGTVRQIQPAAEIVRDIMNEARGVASRLRI